MKLKKQFKVQKQNIKEEGNPWDMTPEEETIANADVEDIKADIPVPDKCPDCGSIDLTPNENNVTFCDNCGTPSWRIGDTISYKIKTRDPDKLVNQPDIRSSDTKNDPYQGVFRQGVKDPRLNETIQRIRKNMGLIDL